MIRINYGINRRVRKPHHKSTVEHKCLKVEFEDLHWNHKNVFNIILNRLFKLHPGWLVTGYAPQKRKTFYISETNCDCSSDVTVTTNNPRNNTWGPRCPNCNKILGLMSWTFVGTIRAENQRSAFQQYHTNKRKN